MSWMKWFVAVDERDMYVLSFESVASVVEEAELELPIVEVFSDRGVGSMGFFPLVAFALSLRLSDNRPLSRARLSRSSRTWVLALASPGPRPWSTARRSHASSRPPQ